MRAYKIKATLTYGRKWSRGMILFLCIGIFLSVAMIPLIILCAVLSSEYAVLICLDLPLIVIPSFSYVLALDRKENKEIQEWRKDAVILPAQAIEADRFKNSVNHIVRLKISVKFYYEGRKIIQESGDKNPRKESIFYSKPGYDAVFRKYINRPIEILYSPKYDEVMLLKIRKQS